MYDDVKQHKNTNTTNLLTTSSTSSSALLLTDAGWNVSTHILYTNNITSLQK